jgi:predicted lipase
MTSHQELSVICGQSYRKSTFEEANIEVLLVKNVIAFRGTDEVRDVFTDLRQVPWYFSELGFVPSGMAKKARRVYSKCLSLCLEKNIDPSEVIYTGHSLGGGLALLVASLAVRDECGPKEVVTFGAPRCGRLKILDGTVVTSYRNGKDIVPILGLCRRHKDLVQIGKSKSYIKDHLMINYVKSKKPSEDFA